MATETLILRPTAGTSSQATRYPENFEVWQTVSEEVADDDTTYVICRPAIGESIYYGIPDEYSSLSPSAVKIRFRVKGSTNATMSVGVYTKTSSSANSVETSVAANIPLSDSYQDYEVEVPSESMQSLCVALMTDGRIQVHFMPVLPQSEKNSTNVCMTQTYIELTYGTSEEGGEDDTSESIYIKQNGSWVAITGTIYHKENGVWVATDSSVLQNGTQYIVIKAAE